MVLIDINGDIYNVSKSDLISLHKTFPLVDRTSTILSDYTYGDFQFVINYLHTIPGNPLHNCVTCEDQENVRKFFKALGMKDRDVERVKCSRIFEWEKARECVMMQKKTKHIKGRLFRLQWFREAYQHDTMDGKVLYSDYFEDQGYNMVDMSEDEIDDLMHEVVPDVINENSEQFNYYVDMHPDNEIWNSDCTVLDDLDTFLSLRKMPFYNYVDENLFNALNFVGPGVPKKEQKNVNNNNLDDPNYSGWFGVPGSKSWDSLSYKTIREWVASAKPIVSRYRIFMNNVLHHELPKKSAKYKTLDKIESLLKTKSLDFVLKSSDDRFKAENSTNKKEISSFEDHVTTLEDAFDQTEKEKEFGWDPIGALLDISTRDDSFDALTTILIKKRRQNDIPFPIDLIRHLRQIGCWESCFYQEERIDGK